MIAESLRGLELKRPGTARLRIAFLAVWFTDLIATIAFFFVPYAYELNPVTVLCYGLFGLPGVVLAALSYAGIIVAIGHFLSNPLDGGFVAVMASMYAALAANNIVLLCFREPLFELAAL